MSDVTLGDGATTPPLRTVEGPSAVGGGQRRFFDLLWLMAATEFKRVYFGTVLGYIWSLLRPLMFFGVLLFVFTQVFKVGSEHVQHYAVLLLMGIVLFTFFQEAQQAGLVPHLSALENVELGLALRGLDGRRLQALAALDAVGLGERATQRVARLSQGERARVAIARAVATEPLLLIADEPTSRLDGPNAIAVAVLLGRLARDTGAAVVCSTHDVLVIEQADEELRLS